MNSGKICNLSLIHTAYSMKNNENESDPSKCVPILRVLPNDDVPAVRFLGVFFYPNLNFPYHVKTIASKLSKAFYILRTAKNLLTKKSLKAIYYSIFHCYLIYCIPIWSYLAFKKAIRLFVHSMIKLALIMLRSRHWGD